MCKYNLSSQERTLKCNNKTGVYIILGQQNYLSITISRQVQIKQTITEHRKLRYPKRVLFQNLWNNQLTRVQQVIITDRHMLVRELSKIQLLQILLFQLFGARWKSEGTKLSTSNICKLTQLIISGTHRDIDKTVTLLHVNQLKHLFYVQVNITYNSDPLYFQISCFTQFKPPVNSATRQKNSQFIPLYIDIPSQIPADRGALLPLSLLRVKYIFEIFLLRSSLLHPLRCNRNGGILRVIRVPVSC